MPLPWTPLFIENPQNRESLSLACKRVNPLPAVGSILPCLEPEPEPAVFGSYDGRQGMNGSRNLYLPNRYLNK